MIKNYDDTKYYEMADVANSLKKKLYILETQQEFEKQVFEYEKKEIEVPIYDEEGKIIGYDKVLVDDLYKPIMIEEIDPETGEKILVHKYHLETYTDVVANLAIADDGYYICYNENRTDGTLNENFEEYKHQKCGLLKCTKRVFALLLQKLGVGYDTLQGVIATNPQAQLEWDLCVELERNNPLLDVMASKMEITPEQLDALFLYANNQLSEDDFELYRKA